LGASNLSRSFPSAVEAAYRSSANPLSIHVAMGFGRSYGKESGFIGKKFSGISSARIWEALDNNAASSTIAFVTDIGNDLGYELPVDEIIAWVEACVTRLKKRGAHVVLTDLPLSVLTAMSEAKFYLLRSVLFPSCRLSWREMLDRAAGLSQQLNALAETQNISIFTVPNAWYGFDPIHPRARFMRDYWRDLFSLARLNNTSAAERRLSLQSYWRLRTLTTPGLGRNVPKGQFSSRQLLLADGTSIDLY
jgi:hypothetical protein